MTSAGLPAGLPQTWPQGGSDHAANLEPTRLTMLQARRGPWVEALKPSPLPQQGQSSLFQKGLGKTLFKDTVGA